jgi:hypothetical protein
MVLDLDMGGLRGGALAWFVGWGERVGGVN